MAIIAKFVRTEEGFSGSLKTLTLDRELLMLPVENPNPDSETDYPDYRVWLASKHGPFGAAWKRAGEQAGTGYNILLEDPVFGSPIRGHMFQTDEQGQTWSVRWFPPKKQPRQD